MKIKVGLIGARRNNYGIGQFVVREVLNNPNADLIAIMGTTQENVHQAINDLNNRQDVLNKFKGKAYTIHQIDEFFNSNIDLIIICSPPETHEQYIQKALTAGKHVLVEKPLLHNSKISFTEKLKRSKDLIDLANKKKLFLSTNCQRAAAVYDLSEKLNLSKPSSISIELNVNSGRNDLENTKNLFNLLISHPISIFVKYGLIDFKLINIKDYSKQFNKNLSSLIIKGYYSQVPYNITLKQTKEDSFASMIITIDNNSVLITTENNNGKLQTKYATKNSVFYSEDHLKICIDKMIDALYYKKEPLITNSESYSIYTIQEKLNELLFKE